MRRLQIIILFVILTRFTFALGKHFDYVVLNGDTLITYSDIFKKIPNYKEVTEKIYSEIENQDMKINPQNYTSDGHEVFEDHSTWIVKNNKLLLTEIKSGSAKTVYADIRKIFGDKVKEDAIPADWLTDTITLSKGKILAGEIYPMHEYEIDLIINKGCVTKTTSYKNFIARISKFRPSESFIYSNVKWDSLPSCKGKSVYAYIGIKTDENGCFKSFDEQSFVYMDSKIVTDKDNVFLKEAFRIAKLVPEWDVVYRRNKIVIQDFMVFFNDDRRKLYAR